MPFDNTPTESEFVTLLRKARELITDPKRHTNGAMFRDKYGKSIDFDEGPGNACMPKDAVSMCLEGALVAAGLTYFQRQAFGNHFARFTHQSHIGYNDSNTHADVLCKFDRMINYIASRGRTPG